LLTFVDEVTRNQDKVGARMEPVQMRHGIGDMKFELTAFL
jgi:hypothetical protein